MTIGDYVLGTKYEDGDPRDNWAVGWYGGITSPHYNPPRYDVVDNNGKKFRGNGFRRIEQITPECGKFLLLLANEIEQQEEMTVWQIAYRVMASEAKN